MSISSDIPSNNCLISATHALTRTLWWIAQGEPELTQSAVAWVIRNRLTRQARSPAAYADAPLTEINQYAIDKICKEVVAEAAPVFTRSHTQPEGPHAAEPDATVFLQVQEVAQRVWRGDFSDPTGGATRCCRHDHAPSWSGKLEAKALLGSFLFYP